MSEEQNEATEGASSSGLTKNFGVVLFDDEKDPRDAWVAVNGKPAKRIEGMNELPTDVLWWSNMSYESFFRTTESWRIPHLRHDAYLVVKPKDVLIEWNLDPATTPPDYTATFCSTVFYRIMTLAQRLLRESLPKLRPAAYFRGNTLREDLRPLLPPAEYPRGEAASVMQSGQAFAEFTRTTVRGVRGAKIFMLRRPRMSHAMEMLTTPMPKGPFEFKPRSVLRRIAPDRVQWLRNIDEPAMIEVSVQQMEADIAPVYGFGNATDKDRRIPRSWVAHPEFLVMSNFSDIEVKSVYLGKEHEMMNLKLPDPIKAFLSDKFTEFSWTAGVVAETLWRAAALSEEKGRTPKNAQEDRAHTSWRGAWIKAADKTAMFLIAMKLTEMGYSTVSYGLGWVSCLVTEDQIPDLIRDGLTLGLMPKMNDIPEGMFERDKRISWGGDKKANPIAQFTVTQDKNLLWNFDKAPLLAPDQREEYAKKLMASRKKGDLK